MTTRRTTLRRPHTILRRRHHLHLSHLAPNLLDLVYSPSPSPPPQPLPPPLLLLPHPPPTTNYSNNNNTSEDTEEISKDVDALQRLLGYTFRNPSLLVEALTHSSYAGGQQSYQRLEFVGDAVLTLAITNYIYLTNPGMGPGPLSNLRSANISTEKLARVAVRLGLYNYLRRNSPMLDDNVEEFTKEVMKEEEKDCGKSPFGGTNLKAPKVLADIVEAVAAATYVDCGMNLEMLWKVFRGHLEPIITSDNLDEQPVAMLHEVCQKHGMKLDFKHWEKGHKNIFNVFIDGNHVGSGASEQRVIARLNAARDALKNLPNFLPVDMESDALVVVEVDGSKHKLNDLATKNHWSKPAYRVEKEQGPGHDKRFICSVQVEVSSNILVAVGELKSRLKDAENSAAANMLSEIAKNGQQ